MWSKTKQALTNRLANSLNGRIQYNFDVYRDSAGFESSVFSILVDKKPWFITDEMARGMQTWYIGQIIDKNLHGHEYWEAFNALKEEALCYITKSGAVDVDTFFAQVHRYLNVLSVEECLMGQNYMLKMLAVLDRRIGKRTIRKLVDSISDEPEWFQNFLILRCNAEGIEVPGVNPDVHQLPPRSRNMPDRKR